MRLYILNFNCLYVGDPHLLLSVHQLVPVAVGRLFTVRANAFDGEEEAAVRCLPGCRIRCHPHRRRVKNQRAIAVVSDVDAWRGYNFE